MLEMVNAGLVPITVVDDYLAQFWAQVFTDHRRSTRRAVLRSDGDLAVAVRKDNPHSRRSSISSSARSVSTATSTILNQKYLKSTKFVKNATSEAEPRKFVALIDLFRRYGDRYGSITCSLPRRATRSHDSTRTPSAVGAIGVMQLMPRTGREQKVGDIRGRAERSRRRKDMRFIRATYFEDEPMDNLNKGLFTVAAYNAGPGRIRQLRREAGERGLNRMSGSAMSNASRRSESGARRSPTSATSTSIRCLWASPSRPAHHARRRRRRAGPRAMPPG